MLRPDLSAGRGVRRTRSWHGSIGLWLLVGLLVHSATGLTWSTYAGARFDLIQEGLNAHSVYPDTSPTRTDRRRLLGTPPPGGGWRRLPIALIVLGVPATVLIGLALPLLGLSLLGFLLLDTAVRLVARRRQRVASVP